MNNEIYLRIRNNITKEELSSIDSFSNFLKKNDIKLLKDDWSKNILFEELTEYVRAEECYQKCNRFFAEYQDILFEIKENLLNQTVENIFLIDLETKLELIESFIEENDLFTIDDYLFIKGPTNPLLPREDYEKFVLLSDDFYEFTEQFHLFKIYYTYFKECINSNKNRIYNLFSKSNNYIENFIDNLDLVNTSSDLGYDFFNQDIFEKIIDEENNGALTSIKTNNEELSLQDELTLFISTIKTFYNSNIELIKILRDLIEKPIGKINISSFITRDYYSATDEEKLRACICIGYGLIQRILPIIDLCYIAIQNQDNLSNERFLDEIEKIRDVFIEIITKGSFSKYDRKNDAKKLTTQVYKFLENTKETITIMLLSTILKNDVDSILYTKQKLKTYFSIANEEQLDIIVNLIVQKIENKIAKKTELKSIKQELVSIFIKYRIIKDNYQELENSFFQALATGEYLYKHYMTNVNESMDFDYSFISIMYYTALENMLNLLFYKPYALSIESNKEIYTNQVSKYLSVNEQKQFFHWDKREKRHILELNVEIGKMAKLIEKIPDIIHLNKYVQNKYGLKEQDIKSLSNLGKEIDYASKKRNKAAHGADRLSAEEARVDKSLVFNKEISDLYRGLIIDFVKILG